MLSVDLTPRRPEVLPFDFLAKTSLNFPQRRHGMALEPGLENECQRQSKSPVQPTRFDLRSPTFRAGSRAKGRLLGIRTEHSPFPPPLTITTTPRVRIPRIISQCLLCARFCAVSEEMVMSTTGPLHTRPCAGL